MHRGNYIWVFIIPLLLQIFIFKNLGYVFPYTPYIIFIPFLFYNDNLITPLYIIILFFVGFITDIFFYTGGVFSATLITLAYLRIIHLKLSQRSLSLKKPEIIHLPLNRLLTVTFGWTLLGHFLIYFFNNFSFFLTFSSLKDILLHTLISYIFIIIYTMLFIKKLE